MRENDQHQIVIVYSLNECNMPEGTLSICEYGARYIHMDFSLLSTFVNKFITPTLIWAILWTSFSSGKFRESVHYLIVKVDKFLNCLLIVFLMQNNLTKFLKII